MAEHKLSAGRGLIDALVHLGGVLGYAVERELPVQRSAGTPPAVDVAWLNEHGQRFPLIIFEVESRATNAIANNAVKVYGQRNEDFEKPLFYFHVVLVAGENTTRIETLRTLFGTHNYRVYELAAGDWTRLAVDVLTQHRRLKPSLDVVGVMHALESPAWHDIDHEAVLRAIEDQYPGNHLRDHAALAVHSEKYLPQYVRYALHLDESNATFDGRPYYELGSEFMIDISGPLHLGVMHSVGPEQLQNRWLELLEEWQRGDGEWTRIGPHFGLSRDYDELVIGFAPPFWTLVALLFEESPEALTWIAAQILAVLDELAEAEPQWSLFTAVWLLHLAASYEALQDYFESARRFINERGGISRTALYLPPSEISLEDPDIVAAELVHDAVLVPELVEFLAERRRIGDSDCRDPVAFALRLITAFETAFTWNKPLVSMLASAGERRRPEAVAANAGYGA